MQTRGKTDIAENQQSRFFYGYFIVVAGFIVVVMSTSSMSTFGIFFEPLLDEFGWTRAVTSGAMSVSAVISGLFMIVAGRLTDRFGPRLLMTGGSFFTGMGLILLSRINEVWQLSACFAIIAIGGSCYLIPIVTTVTRWFVKRRGMMTSIIISALGTGEMIMPQLARWLISSYGWRNSYIILGVAVIVVISLAAQTMKRDPGQMGQLPYGGSKEKQVNFNVQRAGLTLQEAVRTREFWILCAIMICYFFGQSFIATHIVINATGMGVSRVSAANILVINGAMYIASLNILGNTSERIGKRAGIVTGFIFMAAALALFMIADKVWMLYLSAIIFGLGRGTSMSPMPLLMADVFGLRAFGEIQGAIFFGAIAGGIVGPFITGFIFDVTGSYFLALMTCAVIAVLGAVLTLLIRTQKEKQTVPHV